MFHLPKACDSWRNLCDWSTFHHLSDCRNSTTDAFALVLQANPVPTWPARNQTTSLQVFKSIHDHPETTCMVNKHGTTVGVLPDIWVIFKWASGLVSFPENILVCIYLWLCETYTPKEDIYPLWTHDPLFEVHKGAQGPWAMGMGQNLWFSNISRVNVHTRWRPVIS